jgi:hypothetical protein
MTEQSCRILRNGRTDQVIHYGTVPTPTDEQLERWFGAPVAYDLVSKRQRTVVLHRPRSCWTYYYTIQEPQP